jgi:hypothetical protein
MIVFTIVLYLLLNATSTYASLGFLKVFLAKSHPGCEQALPPSHQKFCQSFETAARCACRSSGMPAPLCQNMKSLHHQMLMVFTTQRAACEFQRDTSSQDCLDSWKCYREGGHDSKGRLCQASGAACANNKVSG